MSLDFSVVICTNSENRWNELSAAVRSVQQQDLPPREIILVVDHNAKLLERARTHFPDLLVVENQEQPGLSGARNSGVGAAKGAVIAFVDDDAVAAVDWLERLADGYADPRVMGVGGTIEPMWSDGQPHWFPDEFKWVVGCTYRGLPNTKATVRNLIGCNMSFRHQVFEALKFRSELGGLSTRPYACEETEICIRARQRWPEQFMLYEPRAVVRHHVPKSRTSWRYFRTRCYSEGLSKAYISQLVGSADALRSEQVYATRTLGGGIVRNLIQIVRAGDLGGLARAGAIVAGLGVTTLGYFKGSLSKHVQ